MSLYPFFDWAQFQSPIGVMMNNSAWLFAVIESIHLVGFTLLGGTVLVMNLRLLGFVLWRHAPKEIARSAHPWLIGSLVAMVITGSLLFFAVATKLYGSFPFWVKMVSLVLAILFTFTVHKRVMMTDEERVGPLRGRLVALTSLVLWAGVGWGGRWIGFS